MQRVRGFTLIELMVVLLLIGLAIGMVNLNLGGSEDRQARYFVDQLAALLHYADENAALQGDLLGLQFNTETNGDLQLSWARNRGGDWLPAEPPFVTQTLPEFLALEVRVDDQPVDLLKEAKTPQVIFSGSGEMTDFELRFRRNEQPLGFIAVDFTGDLVQADTWED